MAIKTPIKKILLISHSQKLGGAERCLIELAQGLKELGHNICVVLPSKGENYEDFLKATNLVIINSFPWWMISEKKFFFHIRIRRLFSHLKAIWSFIKIIKSIKPDLVINNSLVIPSSIVSSKILRVRNIWFIHELGDADHNLEFEFSKKFSFFILKYFSNNIIVNSHFLLDYYSNAIKRHDLVLANYAVNKPEFDLNNFEYKSDEPLNLFLIGQIQVGKGQMDALMAMNLLLKMKVKVELYIIGQISDLNYYEELLNFISKNKIRNIHFKNHCSNPFIYVRGNAIGLVCSRHEAFGRITIEFMKLGIPVIALNKPNNSNLIQNNINGLLYDLNDIDGLANKITKLNENKEIRDLIINNAKYFANETFNVKNYLKPFIKIVKNKRYE